jgi:hypothetical protein
MTKIDDIQSKTKYDEDVYLEIQLPDDMGWDGHGVLFHRTDFWEDGSQSEWYGVELTEKQYEAIRQYIEETKSFNKR